MKVEKIKDRLTKRAMRTVTLRMPDTVVDDLKKIAPQLGYSGYQPLIRAYVSHGLRRDLAELEISAEQVAKVLEELGVTFDIEIIEAAAARVTRP